jgi:hypothetical protein
MVLETGMSIEQDLCQGPQLITLQFDFPEGDVQTVRCVLDSGDVEASSDEDAREIVVNDVLRSFYYLLNLIAVQLTRRMAYSISYQERIENHYGERTFFRFDTETVELEVLPDSSGEISVQVLCVDEMFFCDVGKQGFDPEVDLMSSDPDQWTLTLSLVFRSGLNLWLEKEAKVQVQFSE